jgi:sodium-dependent dicarboxylate transporter 2/3/5
MILDKILSLSIPEEIALWIVIVACVLWITELVPLFVTSLILLFAELVFLLPSLQGSRPEIRAEYFLAPFFSDTVLLFLGGFVLSDAFHKFGLDRKLAHLILRKNTQSLPRLLLALISTSAFLSMWMNNTATCSLMIGISIPFLEGLPRESNWRKAILLGIPFGANIGGMGTPVGTLPNAIAVEYLNQSNSAPSFLQWLEFSLPLLILLVLVVWLVLWRTWGKNEESLDLEESEQSLRISMLSREGFVAAVGIFTILGWLSSEWHQLSNGTIALIPVLGFFGFKILDTKDFRNLSWDVLILMGGGISLGRAIEASGLAKTLLTGLPIEGAGVYFLVVLFSALTILLSSIMSNTSTANLMIPLVLGLGIRESAGLVLVVALAASVAMPLPVSTPPNAIAFGFGQLKSKDMIRSGLVITLTGFLILITLGYWIMKWVQVGNL